MNDQDTTFEHFKQRLRDFVAARSWDQHLTPANLAVSISIESAELLEKFQWGTYGDDETARNEWAAELADIMIYCLDFANVANIDVTSAIDKKIIKAEEKFPISQFNHNQDSHTDYWAIKKQYRREGKE
jgi:dCTP diphosphatase